jgi:hypothetical protein
MNSWNFVQMLVGFLTIVFSVCIFKIFEIELNFITTFILTIFAIGISIFFYSESNKIFNSMTALIYDIKKEMSIIRKDNEKVKNLKTSTSLISSGEVKSLFRGKDIGRSWVK